MDQMLSYFDGKLIKGKSIEFDYIPGAGTLVTIKGVKKALLKGRNISTPCLQHQ